MGVCAENGAGYWKHKGVKSGDSDESRFGCTALEYAGDIFFLHDAGDLASTISNSTGRWTVTGQGLKIFRKSYSQRRWQKNGGRKMGSGLPKRIVQFAGRTATS